MQLGRGKTDFSKVGFISIQMSEVKFDKMYPPPYGESITPVIWEKFLRGTWSWTLASLTNMVLSVLIGIYYVLEVDSTSQKVIGISFIISIVAVYRLSADVRDIYRYRVLKTDPALLPLIKRNIGGPSDCVLTTRAIFSALFLVISLIIFIIGICGTEADKITGCAIELQILAATAVLTKTFQDREDARFLSSFRV